MGCAASSQGSGVINTNNKLEVHHAGKKDCINPETGEREPCDKMVIKSPMGNSPLKKTNSLTIADKSEQHARTGEEPAHPLPEGDYGDMKLGITTVGFFLLINTISLFVDIDEKVIGNTTNK